MRISIDQSADRFDFNKTDAAVDNSSKKSDDDAGYEVETKYSN
jgi:hypothetical protein